MLTNSTSFGDSWFAGTHTWNKGKKKHKTQHKHTKDFILHYTCKMGSFDKENRCTKPRHRHTQDGGPPGSVQDERRREKRNPWAGRTIGSAGPMSAPIGLSFGGKLVLIHSKVVLYVPIFVSHGNRPIQAIKGGGETPSFTTHFGYKKEKGRVHLRAIL